MRKRPRKSKMKAELESKRGKWKMEKEHQKKESIEKNMEVIRKSRE